MLNRTPSLIPYINIVCILFLVCLIQSCTTTYNKKNTSNIRQKSAPNIRNAGGRPINAESGKCFAKAKYPDQETYDWVEIICEVFQTKKLKKQLQTMLSAQHYDIDREELNQSRFGPSTKKALIQFQLDQRIPSGCISIETMKLLGIL